MPDTYSRPTRPLRPTRRRGPFRPTRRSGPLTPTRDRGYATAEAAVAIPALMAVLALAVAVVVSVGAQLRCVDAARVGARVAARGDADTAVVQAAIAAAPHGAHVTVRRRGDQVEVVVTADVLASRLLPAIHVGARAVAEAETGASAP